MPRTAAALQNLGHKRRYLATERPALFPGQTPEWVRRHSRQIVDGWYADTNLSLAEKQRLVREILRANGLRDGVDVIVLWQRARVHATGTYPVPVKINI